MPKVQQIIPSDIFETSKLNQNSSRRQQDRSYARGEAKSIPQVENPNIEKSSLNGKSHYFQQFHGTKRFVNSFLKKNQAENTIESEIRRLSVTSSLPTTENFVICPNDTIDIPNQSRNMNTSKKRPSTAGMSTTTKSRNFEVHFGVRAKDYSNEDIQYYQNRFVVTKSTLFEGGEILLSSPDKVFDEQTAKRIKKKPKIPSISTQEVAIVREEAFPEWMVMRENAMTKLIGVVTAIVSSSRDDKLKFRQEFMSLLTVLQRYTLKVVEFYISNKEQLDLRLQNATREEKRDVKWQTTMDRWNEWVTYIEEIPTSMNWLEENPFKIWSGIHFTLNPLLASFDLYNELAVVLNERLHEIIQSTRSTLFHVRSSHFMSNPAVVHDLAKQIASIHNIELPKSNIEPLYLPEIMSIMAKELRYDESLHHRLFRASEVLRAIHDENKRKMVSLKNEMHITQEQQRIENAFSPDIAHYNRLTFLVFRSNKLEELESKATIIRGNTRIFNTKNYFHLWRRCKYYEVSVRYMAMRRKMRIFHWILEGLNASKLQKYRLIALRERVLKSQLNVLWDRWRRNLNWWKKFDSLYERCNRDRVQYAIDKWQKYLDEKQKERISYLLPLLQLEFQRQHQTETASDSEGIKFPNFKIFEWLKAKATDWIEKPTVQVVTNSLSWMNLAHSSCLSPFRCRRPHHQIDDDENDNDIHDEPFKANNVIENDVVAKNIALLPQKRILLRGMEEKLAESFANSFVLQKRSFRAWRSAYIRRILLHRLCFIMQDYQRWAAWRQWRACMKEWRFEAKIEKRTQDMLREMTLLNSDRNTPSPVSFLSTTRPSQRSLLSRSMSATTDGDDFEDNESIAQFKYSEGRTIHTSRRLSSSDSHDSFHLNQQFLNVKSPIAASKTEKTDVFSNTSSFQLPARAMCLKDVPIVYRRRQRFSDNEIPAENANNDRVTDRSDSMPVLDSSNLEINEVAHPAPFDNREASENQYLSVENMNESCNRKEHMSTFTEAFEHMNEVESSSVEKGNLTVDVNISGEVENSAPHLSSAEEMNSVGNNYAPDQADHRPKLGEKESVNIVSAHENNHAKFIGESAQKMIAQASIDYAISFVMSKLAQKDGI